MKLKQTPEQWKAANPATKDLIRKEVSKVSGDAASDVACDEDLLDWVWHAFACAATYHKPTDKYRLERMRDTQELAQGRRAIKANAERLVRALKNNPKLASVASTKALFSLRAKGIELKRTDGAFGPLEDLFVATLSEIAEGVKHPALGLRDGNFTHQTSHGCLGYPAPIKSSRLPDADFMLLFAVVLYFRFRSLGGWQLQQGEPMPAGGKPHFGAAAAIVKIIFPKSGAADYATAQTLLEKRLKAKPGMVLVSWAHE